MTYNSLISVMIPCYNAVKTLPMALASLICQTYEDWECILVDDGSADNPYEIVSQINDSRIRYIRLEQNMGRGIARQTALDNAKGKYLCMLDADDWIYSDKLQKQIEVMESNPEIVLVSTGMAIVNGQNELAGVRCRGNSSAILGPFNKLVMPPVAHAPSMIRMSNAKQVKYDQNFLLGQDVDFLLKILWNNYWCILSDITYVYSEYDSVTLKKVLQAHFFNRQMFWKYKQRFPIASRVNIAKAIAKSFIYRIFFSLGLGSYLINKRSQRPGTEDLKNFHSARQTVLNTSERLVHQAEQTIAEK